MRKSKLAKQPASQLADVPEFVVVVKTERGIRIPRGAKGRQHSLHVWGQGSGGVGWSPVTQVPLPESGWRPSRWDPERELPATYSVRFVGYCPACQGRRDVDDCKRCRGRDLMPISGWILVSPEHPRAHRQVTPVGAIEFERAEWRHWRARIVKRNPLRGWDRDGVGPVRLTAAALGKARDLLHGFNELCQHCPESEVVQVLLNEGYLDDLMDLQENLERLYKKVVLRRVHTAPKGKIERLARGSRDEE